MELPNIKTIDSWEANGDGRKICDISASHSSACKVKEAYHNNYRLYVNISKKFQKEYEISNGEKVPVYFHLSIRI